MYGVTSKMAQNFENFESDVITLFKVLCKKRTAIKLPKNLFRIRGESVGLFSIRIV